jgi:hypothetical protein
VDDTGKIVREVKVASEPKALLAVLANPAYHFKRIGLEAGPMSQWLFNALAEAELPVTESCAWPFCRLSPLTASADTSTGCGGWLARLCLRWRHAAPQATAEPVKPSIPVPPTRCRSLFRRSPVTILRILKVPQPSGAMADCGCG